MIGLAAPLARAGSSSDPFAAQLEARKARLLREGARPEAVVPLLGIEDLWERVRDRSALLSVVQKAASGRAQPEVRARASFIEAELEDRLGHSDEAAKLRDALGLITKFWIVGPFDNEGKAGHAAVYQPEKELAQPLDPKARFAGKERPVGWRLYPEVASAGLERLEPCLRPDSNVTAYATVAVRAPRAMAAAVRVGSSGAVKVWVDGRLAIDHDVYRPARFDQDAGAVALASGWNRVTVKLSAKESGTIGFYLRLTRPDGAPLAGRDRLEVSTRLEDLNAARQAAPSQRAGAVVDLGKALESAVKRHPKDARALTDLGIYLFHVAPEDPELHRAADLLTQAAKLAPSPEAWGRVAAAEIDPNDRHKSLAAGLALVDAAHPGAAAPLHTLLGELFSRERRDRRAETEWLAALAADRDYYPAELRRAELTADRGLPARAAAELTALAKGLASPPLAVLRAEANLALRRGRRAEAASWLERLRKAEANDTETLEELFSEARSRGKLAPALALLDALTRARPDLLSTALDRAELYDGAGRLDDAQRAIEAALTISPDDPRLLERDGRLLHRLGREADALARFARSLELKPQNPDLRDYLEELRAAADHQHADPHHDLVRSYSLDVPHLIARYGKEKDASGAPARVLFDGTAIRVHPNGLSETYTQRVVQILDERGAESEGDFVIRFTPDTQSVEVRAARLYRKNGDVLEAVSTDEQDLSEPWYGLYYDVRGEVVRFSALEPGDVIDVEYVVSDVGRRNLLADYFGDLHFFQEELPRTEQRYVLIAPKERTLYFNKPRLAGLDHFDKLDGDERIYTFHAEHTPKVDTEPGMPGYSDVAAYLHVSTYRTWSEVAAWYRGLVKGQLEPDQAIISAVATATRGLTDERAKIRALYDLVVKRTRYVGLEFGIHGYQPYRVAQVFARKFGDCKDKASLLAVMLRQAGIPASLVLARTRQGGDLDAEPASLAPFDHAIVWVPKYDLYLDGTAEFSGSAELPAQDQDIPVLQVSTGKLVRTPVLPAAQNLVTTDWNVALEASGDARVKEQLNITGEAAHGWRDHYQSPGERMEKYDQAWNGKHPGAKVESVQMSLDALEEPVTVRAEVTVPHWARPDSDAHGATLVMPALGREPDMLRSYARLSTRKYDLVLGYKWRQEERVTVNLPPGFRARRLPEPRTVETPFGKFTLTAEERGNEVAVTGILEVDRHRIRRADYPAFRRFCAAVDDAVGQDLVLGRDREARK